MSSDHHHVQVFTDVPAHLLQLLEARLPQSITLLRRLQFTTFPTGRTDSARIIVASDVPLRESSASNTIRHFTATYLDPSLGLETNMWLYSTFEDSHGAIPASPTLSPDEDAICRQQIIAVLNEARHQARVYPIQPLAHPDHIFIGSLHNAVREVALASGLRFGPTPTYEYEKFIFRIDKLPLPHKLELPSDMVWGSGTVRDCELVKARTSMPRSVKLLLTLPSLFIKLKDGTPVAWAFLDKLWMALCVASTARGLAKAVSSELLRTKTSAFSSDNFAAADVAPDNTSSQAM
ncbi:GNAT family, partial [Fusarium sp. NRRL 25303]